MRAHLIPLFMLIVVSSAQAETAALPSDPQYWRYHQWYLDHSEVEVYVDGNDGQRLLQVLNDIALLQRRNVSVKRVVVIGGLNFNVLEESQRKEGADLRSRGRLRDPGDFLSPGESISEIQSARRSLGIVDELSEQAKAAHLGAAVEIPNPRGLMQELGLEHSPSWKVSTRGEVHWLPDVERASEFFSEGGRFLGLADVDLRRSQSSSHPFATTGPKIPGAEVNLPLFARTYSVTDSKHPKDASTSDVRPNCEKGGIRKVPVLFDSRHLDYFDLLYYQMSEPAQASQAASWSKLAVPFLEGDLSNPFRKHDTLLQEYARFFDIRCLPTRVHYIFENGRRFEEYREGTEASH